MLKFQLFRPQTKGIENELHHLNGLLELLLRHLGALTPVAVSSSTPSKEDLKTDIAYTDPELDWVRAEAAKQGISMTDEGEVPDDFYDSEPDVLT